MIHRPHSRRSFLRGTILTAGGTLLAACTRPFGRRQPTWLPPIPMGTAPDPVDATGFER